MGFNRQKLIARLGMAALGLAALAGCELAPLPQATPTPNVEELPSSTATITPTLTLSAAPMLVSPTPTETAGPPTETPTPDPYATYIIQPNDTLLYIIQLPPFNYRNDIVINEILRLNPNIPDANHLPGPRLQHHHPAADADACPGGLRADGFGAAERAAGQPARQRADHPGTGRGRSDDHRHRRKQFDYPADHRHAQPADFVLRLRLQQSERRSRLQRLAGRR